MGQLGDGGLFSQARAELRPVVGLAGVTAISAGYDQSLAITAGGAVWEWGRLYGNCGTNLCKSSVPVLVEGIAGARGISAGQAHNLAVTAGGQVWAWGSNDFGQLGNGTNVGARKPLPAAGLAGKKMVAVAAGQVFSLALSDEGKVFGWGSNAYGQLGIADRGDQPNPQESRIDNAAAIAAGGDHSMFLVSGQVFTSGSNQYGQLGRAPLGGDSDLPAAVPQLSNATGVWSGGYHSLVLSPEETDLSVLISGGPDPAVVGSEIAYEVSVTNNGPIGARQVVMTDALPAEVNFRSASPASSCDQAGGTVTCRAAAMPPGAVARFSIVVATTRPGQVGNTAVVSGGAVDPVPANNSATATVTVLPPGVVLPPSPPDPQAPQVTGIEPKNGPVAGGTRVLVTGTNLAGAAAVYFGDQAVTARPCPAGGGSGVSACFTQNSDREVVVFSPAVALPRTVDVTVQTGNGTSARNPADLFSYLAEASGGLTTTASEKPPAGAAISSGVTVTPGLPGGAPGLSPGAAGNPGPGSLPGAASTSSGAASTSSGSAPSSAGAPFVAPGTVSAPNVSIAGAPSETGRAAPEYNMVGKRRPGLAPAWALPALGAFALAAQFILLRSKSSLSGDCLRHGTRAAPAYAVGRM